MDRLPTRVDRSGQDWQRRREQNLALAADLKERLEAVKQGGGGKYVERHRSRGKMLPRERIAEICDPGSPFLELSSLAANELYGKNPLHWWPAIWGTKVDVQNQHTKGVVLDEFGPSRVYMIDHCTLKFRKKADATLYCLKYLS